MVVLLHLPAFFGPLQGGNLYKYVIVLLRISAFFGHLHDGHFSIKMVEEMQKHVAGTLKTETQTFSETMDTNYHIRMAGCPR